MKQSLESAILQDQNWEKLQQAYDKMGQKHSEQIRHLHGKLSDLSSDITLRTLERDQWRSEAQKLKRQFDQKMASGNLGTWVSRCDPSPASPLRDIRQSHQGANDGAGVNNKYLYCKIWQYSFSLA